MHTNAKERCEACGARMTDWRISPDCVLSRCPDCFHIKRDLQRCYTHAREHAWGGSSFFDKIRTYLTMRRLNGLLPGKKPLKILEIGFGSGRILLKFLERGHAVYGIEAEMLEIDINERLKKEGTLYFDTIENVDFPEEEFDVIYGIHVIEHVENPEIVFKKCCEALGKDGVVYFLTPNSRSKGLALFRDAWWNLEDPTHIRFFSDKSVKTMLHKAGFTSVKTGTPIWDSLTLEINSLFRYFTRNSKKHGVLENTGIKIIDAVLIPIVLVIRSIYPPIRPTLEIIAKKT